MQPYQNLPALDSDPQLPQIKIHHPSSPRHPSPAGATPTPTAGARRKIGVAVDLSDESAYAVRWAVHHYIRPGDAVILLHVSPTNVLFGADWGSIDLSINTDPNSDEEAVNAVNNNDHTSKRKLEDDFDAFTASKAADLAKPLREAQIPFKIHIVKDHDMKERLCLEVERLGLSAVIMGSRGFGAVRRGSDGKLGSVSDYCVHHCVCPVVVVRYPDDLAATAEAVVAVKEGDESEAVVQPHKKVWARECSANTHFLDIVGKCGQKPLMRTQLQSSGPNKMKSQTLTFKPFYIHGVRGLLKHCLLEYGLVLKESDGKCIFSRVVIGYQVLVFVGPLEELRSPLFTILDSCRCCPAIVVAIPHRYLLPSFFRQSYDWVHCKEHDLGVAIWRISWSQLITSSLSLKNVSDPKG
ncbi:hypothetical protein VNO80_25595 [Phaseolus coccineus]|uniref:UspA domain-containing protein n=1 Tax=Phaseolus coccineus TaxID=3886 RepID=A0AAN9LY48_PHACN